MGQPFANGWGMQGIQVSAENSTIEYVQSFENPLFVTCLIILGVALGAFSEAAYAADAEKAGRETGLPLPRFVSLKAKSVNLRVGPGRKYKIAWHYRKKGLPVEVIQEFDQWRRIRDSDGSTGWVLHSLLSSKRTAILAPWDVRKDGAVTRAVFHEGKKNAHKNASTVANLQSGLLVDVDACYAGWCEVEAQSVRFYLKQYKLWGVYPDEGIEG